MLTVHITDDPKPAMLRAIRAACNELLGETHTDLTTQAAEHNSRAVALHAAAEAESDKAAAALTLHNKAQAFPNVENDRRFWVMGDETVHISELSEAERERLESECVRRGIAKTLEIAKPPASLLAEQAEELDSASQPWSAELHSSSRAKVADGTWKKRRGAVVAPPATVQEATEQIAAAFAESPLATPPVPPAPTASAEPIMPKIFALITSQIVTINQAVEAAQAEGFADLGANGLGGAPREAQEAVLRKLEG